MVVLEVYSTCLKTKYKTTLLSKTTLFVCLAACAKLIIPFLIGYGSGDFWLKQGMFYEQPDVKFKGKYLLIGITDNFSRPIICTTFPEYYAEVKDYDECSTVKVREIDDDFDGKMDSINFDVNLNTPKEGIVLVVSIVIALDYKLKRDCPLQMESAIVFQQTVLPFISEINVFADLKFEQTFPLYCNPKHVDNTYNYSIVNIGNDHDILKNILTGYARRNVSTHLSNIYTSSQMLDNSNLELTLNVRYPQQQFRYRTPFWQTIKWAWIQYFSIYIVISWFIDVIKRYLFENRLLLFYKQKTTKNS